MNSLPPLMTYGLILSILVISSIGFSKSNIIQDYSHFPYLEKRNRQFYRWLSCGFLHANWLHLGLNLFVLYQFGSTIEHVYKAQFGFYVGGFLFILIYFIILIAGCIPTYFHHLNNTRYSSIGASGAISGILFIYVLYYPFQLLYLFGMVPIPAILFAPLYLIYSWWASKNPNDHIDHYAHFYGSIIGLFLGLLVKYIL
ncbi:MAG: rhomboid family intramembrane serine protease [Saprospiraceae bacterium]|nr:rhomboid family intramembrane serine protease [Saprospiraceae bacterium]